MAAKEDAFYLEGTSIKPLPQRTENRKPGRAQRHPTFQEDEEKAKQEAAAPESSHIDNCKQQLSIPRIQKWEYLDHTADIQFHAWGDTLAEAFEQVCICMFSYMTDLSMVECDPDSTISVEVNGHDLISLLYAFLDEFLFRFSTDFVVCKDIRITTFDQQRYAISAIGFGEVFDLKKHPQGTEIKAITFSNMQIHEEKEKSEVYVIVDI